MDILTYSLSKKYTDKSISSIAKGMAYKGSVSTYNNLPLSENKKGDVYTVSDTRMEYVWSIESASGILSDWEPFGDSKAIKDLQDDVTDIKQSITELDSDKVDKVDGKGLSTNDYTTAEKTKLANLKEWEIVVSEEEGFESTLENGKEYRFGGTVAQTFYLPQTISLDFMAELIFTVTSVAGTYPQNITWTGTDVSNNVFIPVTGKRYDILLYNDSHDEDTPNIQAIVRGV